MRSVVPVVVVVVAVVVGFEVLVGVFGVGTALTGFCDSVEPGRASTGAVVGSVVSVCVRLVKGSLIEVLAVVGAGTSLLELATTGAGVVALEAGAFKAMGAALVVELATTALGSSCGTGGGESRRSAGEGTEAGVVKAAIGAAVLSNWGACWLLIYQIKPLPIARSGIPNINKRRRFCS